jgi:heptosyltransferase-2
VLSQASRPTSQPIIHIAEEEALYAQEFLHKHNLLTEPLVAMAVGAAYGSAKRWLPERYAQVAKWCVKELNSRVIFLGSKAEYSQIDEIQQQAGPGTYNMAGQLSIRQTFAVLQRCRVVVCNDSGLMHAAAALGVPIVALFGPTSVEETGPAGVAQTIIHHPIECAPCFERECPLQHHQCMKNISIEEVQQAIEKNVLI